MSRIIDIAVPDIGDFADVPVIDLFVKAGDAIAVDEPICTLESDKATMDVPATVAGIVREVLIAVGSRVGEGAPLIRVEVAEEQAPEAPAGGQQASPAAGSAGSSANAAASPENPQASGTVAGNSGKTSVPQAFSAGASNDAPTAPPRGAAPAATAAVPPAPRGKAHASPSVRRLARELGVDLARIAPADAKGRIAREDVIAHVKAAMQAGPAAAPAAARGAPFDLLPWPAIDFAKYGAIDRQPRSRIQKISAANLHRNWVMMPHVTNFDEADITELEDFRQRINAEQGKDGAKVTLLAFLIKAAVHTLQAHPAFNASLDGDTMVYKRYWHIGFAADTPNGLVVPVIRDADRKSVLDIARESSELARLARDGKLKPEQMQGGSFTVSSLGGIGGTGFTPIINAPEVAILGVTRSTLKPVWDGKQFAPRLMLPLGLSWDHRAVDGAAAARFLVHLARLLADFRRVSL